MARFRRHGQGSGDRFVEVEMAVQMAVQMAAPGALVLEEEAVAAGARCAAAAVVFNELPVTTIVITLGKRF